MQKAADTPLITGFNISDDATMMDVDIDYRADWQEVPEMASYKNPHRIGWEEFIAHVATDAPFASDFASGIRDVQLSEACLESAASGGWVSMAPVT
jgi:predicted dehydrogenase